MITEKRLAELADEKIICKVSWEERIELARELLKLRQQVNQLGAELAHLNSGPQGFFSYDSDSGFDEHATADEAMKAADAFIDYYRGDACDGWSEEVERVCWGVIMQKSTEVGKREIRPEDKVSDHAAYWCDYTLLPLIETPATDAVLISVRADGIHFVANHLLAAWDSGFIQDTPQQAYDIIGAILTAIEFLPNATAEELKRDFADQIRSEIAAQAEEDRQQGGV